MRPTQLLVLLFAAGVSAEELGVETQAEPPVSMTVEGLVGLTTFTGEQARGLAVGPALGARFGYRPGTIVGGEVAYEHGAYDLSDPRIIGSHAGSTDSLLGTLRLTLPTESFSPYVFLGLGASRWSVPAVDNVREVYAPDLFLTVPAGAGVETQLGTHLMAGARFAYDVLYGNSLLRDRGDIGGGAWSVTVDVGASLR